MSDNTPQIKPENIGIRRALSGSNEVVGLSGPIAALTPDLRELLMSGQRNVGDCKQPVLTLEEAKAFAFYVKSGEVKYRTRWMPYSFGGDKNYMTCVTCIGNTHPRFIVHRSIYAEHIAPYDN